MPDDHDAGGAEGGSGDFPDLLIIHNPALDDRAWPCAVCGALTVLHCATCALPVCAGDRCPQGCDG